MAQVTESLIAEYERAHAEGKHAPMTIGEEQQLIHAWKQQHQSQQSPARVEGDGPADLGECIAHVGGVVTDAGRVEFGSVMAVKAMIHHLLKGADIKAWQHKLRPAQVISDEVKELWLKVNPKHVEHYTVPLTIERALTQRMAVKEGEFKGDWYQDDSNMISRIESAHPVSDDHQAKDAALAELHRRWNAGELSDTEFAYAIDAALSTTKQEEV